MKRFYTHLSAKVYKMDDDEFEKIHQKCDVTGSTCGSAIGLGKHKSLAQHFREKKDSRIGKKHERTDYEKAILQYGKTNEIRGLRMATYFYNIEFNSQFFYLPLMKGFDSRYGATPDGLIDSDGLVEVKCPWTKNIYTEIREGSLPLDHFCQMQMEMACSLRDYGIYVCWTPTETAILKINYNHAAWDDIYTRIMIFSESLNLKEEPNFKFKSGEKATLVDKFKKYAKTSIEYIYFIKRIDNKPFWI